MLSTLKDLFDTFTHAPGDSPAERLAQQQLATAFFLVEVVRRDGRLGDAERRTVSAKLASRFALDSAAAAELLGRAEATSRTAFDYQHYTGPLTEQYTQPQKIQLVEDLWDAAYADTEVDANEHHVISKLAGLLHVTHGEYIGAKLRAKEAAGLA